MSDKIKTLDYIAELAALLNNECAQIALIDDAEIGPTGKAYFTKLAVSIGEIYAQAMAAGAIAASFMDQPATTANPEETTEN